MRVLFDHNLPHKLRSSLDPLGEHEIATASYMGWGDLKNGELLRIAEESGIEVLVTGDQASSMTERHIGGQVLVSRSTAAPGTVVHIVSRHRAI